jgi:hypothetical protein
VLEHFADPRVVLVVDESGDLKKSTATVGVPPGLSPLIKPAAQRR